MSDAVPPPGTAAVLVVQHEEHCGAGRLEASLCSAARLDVRRPDLGDPLPPDLAGYGGLVVLGGAVGVLDDGDAPWLPATRRLLADAVAAGLPTLGICLGAQMLAVATGGTVERGAAGLEAGVVALTLTPEAGTDPLLAPVRAASGEAPPVAQFHQDAVTRLPPGAVLLASSERYPHQAFRVGAAAWGLQYHPEVTAADFAAWVHDGHRTVRGAGLDPAGLVASYTDAEPALAAGATAHGGALAALLGGRVGSPAG